jgi:hypothetical protein
LKRESAPLTSPLRWPFVGRHAKHRWFYRGITKDGEFRLQCRCGATSLRPIYARVREELDVSSDQPPGSSLASVPPRHQ